ncbi:MAG: NAD(P)H-dependent oxidoreductase [Pyrinomonadaceae bacterium]|nr:NAD(P)H-dependent oxidoreductase [Pyrinomonadaceae bacterium]
MQKKKILAISGSTKANSSNELILRMIAKIYAKKLDFEIYTEIAELPHFNPDLDIGEPPTTVKKFRELIEKADGVLISTPEYVFSLPGSLKNALEWTVSTVVFTDKPTAFIIAAASGEKAFESLDLILKTIGAKVSETSKLIIKAAKGKLNSQGEITDQKTLQEIEILMKSLIETLS